ncbi:MAG: HAD hydrolase family protein [Verrucomicrobia bacterium]|nr:HAD hydrolase family protein [Verrucomicrobiota bacterium]MDE3099638.1 HAD hydrolase family protein [Verrucomicrobiota bacterium]
MKNSIRRLPPAARLRNIKLFLCDVDGVLTDGSIFIGGPSELKRFNIRDGLGLVLARRAGLKIGWVSARPSPASRMRALELGIHYLIQQHDRLSKSGAIERLLSREGLEWKEVCFVGDDVVDLAPLAKAGIGVAVADAGPEAKEAADWVTRHAGGHGAVREVIEMILQAQGKWEELIRVYRE